MDFLNEEIRKAGKEETRNGTGKAGRRKLNIEHRTSNIEHRRTELPLLGRHGQPVNDE
jgi:hypothetical protein